MMESMTGSTASTTVKMGCIWVKMESTVVTRASSWGWMDCMMGCLASSWGKQASTWVTWGSKMGY